MSLAEQYPLDPSVEKTSSGVSWGAVLAGAATAAALALILLVLGTGLGMSAISPWPGRGMGTTAFGTSTIAWLIFTQVVAAAAGGYLAGRLRIKWATVHTDEVYFRDTAHGFLSWAIAALMSASLIASFAGTIATAGTGIAAASTLSAGAGKLGESVQNTSPPHDNRNGDVNAAALAGSQKYLVRSLFRATPSAADGTPPITVDDYADAGLIFANSIHSPSLPSQDQQYLAQIIAKRTGLSQDDAAKRVEDTFKLAHDAMASAEQSARDAADKARKAAAYSALWMFVSLLCGAFFASLAATFGGRQRDRVIHIPASF